MFQRAETAVRLRGVEACRGFFADVMRSSAEPAAYWVAHLDGEARCIHLAAYPGDTKPSRLPLRSILGQAAELGSAGLLLAERRPVPASGPHEPKPDETGRLALAAEAMDMTLLDHLIYSGDQCISMRRAGMI